MVFRIPVFVGLLTHDSGPVRHKGVAVAAGERRHTRRLSIQLMFKENRKIFLSHLAECNSHLIRPNEKELSHRWRQRALLRYLKSKSCENYSSERPAIGWSV